MRIVDLSQPMWELLFAVRLSIRYHDRRKRFFAGLHRCTSAAGVLLGSAAAAAFLGTLSSQVGLYAALGVTAVTSIDLVIGFATAATTHHDLKNRFIALEQDIIDAHDDTHLGEHQRRRLEIEKDEPPIRRALCSLVHNELVRAEYSPDVAASHLVRVPLWRRLSAQLFEHGAVAG